MRLSDVAVLVAVGVVVLLVSLPRLREFALRENESDARTLVERLGRMIERQKSPATHADIASLLHTDVAFVKQLDDAEFLDGGTLLRRHGYLFDVATTSGSAVVRAWPWNYRKTGTTAFAWCADSGLVGHRNGDGTWSGLYDRPPVHEVTEWPELELAE